MRFTLICHAQGRQCDVHQPQQISETAGPWSLELAGSKGSVKILMNVFPDVYLLKSSEWTAAGQSREWRPLPNDPTQSIPAEERRFRQANQRVVNVG